MGDMKKQKMELARAYIPFQQYTQRWHPLEGLKRGTIFPELYQPYMKPKQKCDRDENY